MDLNLELPGNHHYISGLGPAGVRIGDHSYPHSVLVSPTRIQPDWPPQTVGQLELKHLAAIFELEPEVVLMGTGISQVFLSQDLVYEFYHNKTGIEVMSSEAACRTFNVLVTEGRIVVAALMPIRQPG